MGGDRLLAAKQAPEQNGRGEQSRGCFDTGARGHEQSGALLQKARLKEFLEALKAAGLLRTEFGE